MPCFIACFYRQTMIGRLQNTKRIIKGLAISSPQRPTVLELERDYKQYEGEEIPYRALGYSDVTQFLRSIADVVYLDPDGFVHPVYSEATQHLRPLVEQQMPTYIPPHKRNTPIVHAAESPNETCPPTRLLDTFKSEAHRKQALAAAAERARRRAEHDEYERESQELRCKFGYYGMVVPEPSPPPSPPPVTRPKKHFDFSWVNVGDRVTLTTQHQIFSGTVSLIGQRVLELSDAIELTRPSTRSGGGTQLFYPRDIYTLRQERTVTSGDSVAPSGGLLVSLSDEQPFISASGFARIAELVDSARLINSFDASYHAAVADLRSQSVIAVDAMPRDFRLRANLLTAATTRAVYVFDLAALHTIHPEFAEIFALKKPLKAMHNSPNIVANLLRNFTVSAHGVFDTALAYWTAKEERNELVEAAHDLFRVPKAYFEHGQDKWKYRDRPVSRETLKYMAKRAVYVLMLYMYLHGNMLAKSMGAEENDSFSPKAVSD